MVNRGLLVDSRRLLSKTLGTKSPFYTYLGLAVGSLTVPGGHVLPILDMNRDRDEKSKVKPSPPSPTQTQPGRGQ